MRWTDPTPEQEAEWRDWVAGRPPHVRAVAERFDPWTLYLLGTSNHRVTVYSFSEHADGSVTVVVNCTGKFNRLMFSRQVFGVSPDDLEECPLPWTGDEELEIAARPPSESRI